MAVEGEAVLPAWLPDPSARHEYRYWDGVRWTEHVADQGRQGADVLGSATYPPPSPRGNAPTSPPAPRKDPTAVLGRRYGAFFIDLAVAVVAFLVIFFPLATKHSTADAFRQGCYRSSSTIITCDSGYTLTLGDSVYVADSGSVLGLDVLFSFLYFGVFAGMTGATIGKYATGIRVVKADGSIVGVPKSLVRWLLFAVDGPLTLFLYGTIKSSTSPGHQRLGDVTARTYVIGKADVGRPVVVPVG